jgi:hypothetical protein
MSVASESVVSEAYGEDATTHTDEQEHEQQPPIPDDHDPSSHGVRDNGHANGAANEPPPSGSVQHARTGTVDDPNPFGTVVTNHKHAAKETEEEHSAPGEVHVLKAGVQAEPTPQDASAPVKVIRAPITTAFLAATSKYGKAVVVAPELTIGSRLARDTKEEDESGPTSPTDGSTVSTRSTSAPSPQPSVTATTTASATASTSKVWNPFAARPQESAKDNVSGSQPVWNPFAASGTSAGSNPFAARPTDEKPFAVRLEEIRAEALKAALLFEETLGDEEEESEDENEEMRLREMAFARREQRLKSRLPTTGAEGGDESGSDDDINDVLSLVQDVRYETGNVRAPSDEDVLAEYAKQFELVFFDDGTPGSVIKAGIQRLQTHLRYVLRALLSHFRLLPHLKRIAIRECERNINKIHQVEVQPLICEIN